MDWPDARRGLDPEITGLVGGLRSYLRAGPAER
jgi:hypothetical protein